MSFINIVWILLWYDFVNYVIFVLGYWNLYLCFLFVIFNIDWVMFEYSFYWIIGCYCLVVGIFVVLFGNVLFVLILIFSLVVIVKRYYMLLIYVFFCLNYYIIWKDCVNKCSCNGIVIFYILCKIFNIVFCWVIMVK